MKRPKGNPLFLLGATAAALLLILVWGAIVLARAFPPRTIRMTTGPVGEADYELGQRYRAVLEKKGITLVVEPSAGKAENLERLRDPKAGFSAGFSSGGLTTAEKSPGVVSLGTISYDPFWVFCRGLPDPPALGDLAGKRISIGPEGSATRAFALRFLRLNGLDAAITSLAVSARAGGDALRRGDADCVCMMASAEAPEVRDLLADPKIDLLGFPRADAYVALFPFLRKVTLPMGVGNLAANRPPHDVPLVAAAESLLVRDEVHPALQYVLLQAAEEIQSAAGIFQRPGEFPAAQPVDVPLSEEARQFYKSGGSFLQRHLPFWLWVFASRLIVVLVPLLGVIYPLVQLVPSAIGFEVERRLTKLYGELREIESRLAAPGASVPDVAGDLDRLEERIRTTRVPLSYARSLYTLKQHADLVRERVVRGG